MIIQLDGEKIETEADFHKELAKLLNVENFYGYNLDALWDLLSSNVERPITIRWNNAQISKRKMPNIFEEIIKIFYRVQQQDQVFGFKDKFTYELA